MYALRVARFIAGVIIVASVMAGVGMSAANAQATGPLGGPCGAPAQLLQQNPNGGQLLINALQEFLLRNPSALNTVLGAVGGANDQQKTAIATAAAQAAKQLVTSEPATAADMQEKILAVSDPTFNTAAVNAFGDVKLGDIGGAPAAGPLGGLAGGPGGIGALQDIRSTPINTGPFTFGSGTTGLGFVGGLSNSTSTTGSGGSVNPNSFSKSNGVR